MPSVHIVHTQLCKQRNLKSLELATPFIRTDCDLYGQQYFGDQFELYGC